MGGWMAEGFWYNIKYRGSLRFLTRVSDLRLGWLAEGSCSLILGWRLGGNILPSTDFELAGLAGLVVLVLNSRWGRGSFPIIVKWLPYSRLVTSSRGVRQMGWLVATGWIQAWSSRRSWILSLFSPLIFWGWYVQWTSVRRDGPRLEKSGPKRGAMGPSTPGSLRYYIGITGPGTNSNRQQGRILVPIIPLIMYYIYYWPSVYSTLWVVHI